MKKPKFLLKEHSGKKQCCDSFNEQRKGWIKMDPISIAIAIKFLLARSSAAKAGTAGVAVPTYTLVLLTFEEITNWFADHAALKESDKDNLAFTLQEKLPNGGYNTVQGIFNARTQAIPAARAIKSHHVDAKLAAIHATHELAMYS